MQNINKYLLDPHFNVFYSYDKGKPKEGKPKSAKENTYQQKKLEDNVTRALLITISQLSLENRRQFIRKLVGDNIINSKNDFYFDLQGLTPEYIKIKAQAKNKILVTITSSGKPSNNGDNTDNDGGSRADGWILNSDLCLLLEVKVRGAKVYTSQIERHITDNNGFGIKNISDVNQIHKKWHEIDLIFAGLEVSLENEVEKSFVFQFRQFLYMIGETMNFRQFYENKELVDDDIRKEQLRLLLNNVCTELDKKKFSVGSEIKSWGYLNYEEEKNPHISFAISDSAITCYLTISEGNQKNFKAFLLNEKFNEELKSLLKEGYIPRARHYLSLVNYRIVDHKTGQRRGGNHSTFSINLRFCENKLTKNEQQLQKVIKAMENCLGLGKQLEFGLTIDFPKKEIITENGLMEANKKILENPSQLVDFFADFIKNHDYLLEYIKTNKKL